MKNPKLQKILQLLREKKRNIISEHQNKRERFSERRTTKKARKEVKRETKQVKRELKTVKNETIVDRSTHENAGKRF